MILALVSLALANTAMGGEAVIVGPPVILALAAVCSVTVGLGMDRPAGARLPERC